MVHSMHRFVFGCRKRDVRPACLLCLPLTLLLLGQAEGEGRFGALVWLLVPVAKGSKR